jgi:hypothetical protein
MPDFENKHRRVADAAYDPIVANAHPVQVKAGFQFYGSPRSWIYSQGFYGVENPSLG